jgi:hypothetical protein
LTILLYLGMLKRVRIRVLVIGTLN